LETASFLRANGTFHYLTGLPNYPDPQSLRRFLLQAPPEFREQLHRFNDRLRRQFIHWPERRSRLILDLDSTVVTVFGRQEGAEVGYNQRYRGKRSYDPLLCLEANSSFLWDTELRPGNAGTWAGSVELLASCFLSIPSDIRELRVRADAGFGYQPVLEMLDARPAQLAQPTWYDAVCFSTDAVLDGPDPPLRSQSRSLALAAGSSYQVTNTVTIPANAPPSYYLILKADDQNSVFESNETNNWRAFGVGQYRDADGDGIPDWWEQQYFGSITNCAPGADPDGDGMPNLPEYLADTNPTQGKREVRSQKSEIESQRPPHRMARRRPGQTIRRAQQQPLVFFHQSLGHHLHRQPAHATANKPLRLPRHKPHIVLSCEGGQRGSRDAGARTFRSASLVGSGHGGQDCRRSDQPFLVWFAFFCGYAIREDARPAKPKSSLDPSLSRPTRRSSVHP